MTKNSFPRALLVAPLVLCAMLGVLMVGQAAPARAVAGGGPTPFAVTPAATADGTPRSYFVLSGSAGQILRDRIVISNMGQHSETLTVSAARGTTAPNTGSAFVSTPTGCSGTGCWLTGLPPRVSLSAGESRTIPFQVHIPAGSAKKQYLAGITVRSAVNPPPVTVGGGTGSRAQAVIVNEVTVGVAVTIGSGLRSDLDISDVAGAVTGKTSLLQVTVHNGGQTFVRGTGRADCSASNGPHRYPVDVNTVLPGDSGTVQVTATGLPAGSSQCTITIPFADGHPPAVWQGQVTIPTAHPVKRVQVAPGVYAAVPHNRVPTWAITLLVAGGALIVVLAAVVLVLLRRRRAQRA
jgi:hypothetical protein